jgi:hypothetical protein
MIQKSAALLVDVVLAEKGYLSNNFTLVEKQ